MVRSFRPNNYDLNDSYAYARVFRYLFLLPLRGIKNKTKKKPVSRPKKPKNSPTRIEFVPLFVVFFRQFHSEIVNTTGTIPRETRFRATISGTYYVVVNRIIFRFKGYSINYRFIIRYSGSRFRRLFVPRHKGHLAEYFDFDVILYTRTVYIVYFIRAPVYEYSTPVGFCGIIVETNFDRELLMIPAAT